MDAFRLYQRHPRADLPCPTRRCVAALWGPHQRGRGVRLQEDDGMAVRPPAPGEDVSSVQTLVFFLGLMRLA